MQSKLLGLKDENKELREKLNKVTVMLYNKIDEYNKFQQRVEQ
jgi:hypothetical protein